MCEKLNSDIKEVSLMRKKKAEQNILKLCPFPNGSENSGNTAKI